MADPRMLVPLEVVPEMCGGPPPKRGVKLWRIRRGREVLPCWYAKGGRNGGLWYVSDNDGTIWPESPSDLYWTQDAAEAALRAGGGAVNALPTTEVLNLRARCEQAAVRVVAAVRHRVRATTDPRVLRAVLAVLERVEREVGP